MDSSKRWRTTGRIAFTEHDGPGRPPIGVRSWYLGSTAIAVGTALGVVIVGDSLCPEHLAWIRFLGVVGIALSVGAVVCLVRGSAGVALTSFGASVVGLAIGGIDMAHSRVRGSFVVAGFGVAALLTAVPVLRQIRSGAWAERSRQEFTGGADSFAVAGSETGSTSATEAEPAPERARHASKPGVR
jgi:hypothetical protein